MRSKTQTVGHLDIGGMPLQRADRKDVTLFYPCAKNGRQPVSGVKQPRSFPQNALTGGRNAP